jgi:CheY-like chemotaxis protein
MCRVSFQMLKSRNSQLPPQRHQRGGQEAPAAPAGRLDSTPPDAFVIDDEDGICKFVSMTLDALGASAARIHTAEEAVEGLERVQPDIVFLDLALGGSDAVEVIRRLGERRYNGIVQLMSGSKSLLLDDVHRIGALHGLNMSPPLEKPFRKEAIQRAVASLPLYSRPEVTISIAPPLQLGLDVALANGWLELWYHPKIDLRTKALVGVEGLIRYCHPMHGVHATDSLMSKASMQFQLAEGQFAQPLERGEACSKIVDRQRDVVDAQLCGNLMGKVQIIYDLMLADFQDEARPFFALWPISPDQGRKIHVGQSVETGIHGRAHIDAGAA